LSRVPDKVSQIYVNLVGVTSSSPSTIGGERPIVSFNRCNTLAAMIPMVRDTAPKSDHRLSNAGAGRPPQSFSRRHWLPL